MSTTHQTDTTSTVQSIDIMRAIKPAFDDHDDVADAHLREGADETTANLYVTLRSAVPSTKSVREIVDQYPVTVYDVTVVDGQLKMAITPIEEVRRLDQ